MSQEKKKSKAQNSEYIYHLGSGSFGSDSRRHLNFYLSAALNKNAFLSWKGKELVAA